MGKILTLPPDHRAIAAARQEIAASRIKPDTTMANFFACDEVALRSALMETLSGLQFISDGERIAVEVDFVSQVIRFTAINDNREQRIELAWDADEGQFVFGACSHVNEVPAEVLIRGDAEDLVGLLYAAGEKTPLSEHGHLSGFAARIICMVTTICDHAQNRDVLPSYVRIGHVMATAH